MDTQQQNEPENIVLPFKVELSIQCKDLPLSTSGSSKMASQVHIHYKEGNKIDWRLIGKTEVHTSTPNPVFSERIFLDFRFEIIQSLRFNVFEVEKGKETLIGSVESTLGAIVGTKGSKITKPITSSVGEGEEEHETKDVKKTNKNLGTLTLLAEEFKEGTLMDIQMKVSGQHLDKKDFFGKSDPYLEFYRSREDGSWLLVHKTEWIPQTLDPVWKPIKIDSHRLCTCNPTRPLRIQCFDYDRNAKPDFIGEIKTTFEEIRKSPAKFSLINDKKKSKKDYKDSGMLTFELEVTQRPTFLQYINGGTEISLMVAIDYTASNGNPQLPTSLHRMGPELNDYQQVILGVGEILMPYDTDNLVPLYGFGAKVGNQDQVSHCFPVSGNTNTPEVWGIRGILDCYTHSFHSGYIKSLSGPTNMAQIIATASKLASSYQEQDNKSYLILLIITDGEISDLSATTKEIVDATSLPLSIVIVGVGDSTDFEAMKVLDGDNLKLKSSNGVVASRDIVQFVPYNQFKQSGNLGRELLAREVLAEIPTQFVEYMVKNKIKPRPTPSPEEIARWNAYRAEQFYIQEQRYMQMQQQQQITSNGPYNPQAYTTPDPQFTTTTTTTTTTTDPNPFTTNPHQ